MNLWTSEEKQFLERNYRNPYTIKQLAQQLSRPELSVQYKIRSMGLALDRNHKVWADDLLHLLKMRHACYSIKENARFFRVSLWQLRYKIRIMRWTREKAAAYAKFHNYEDERMYYRYWLQGELRDLEKLYGTTPMEELCQKFRRSEVSIYNKAFRLGLTTQHSISWKGVKMQKVKYLYATHTALEISKLMNTSHMKIHNVLSKSKTTKAVAQEYKRKWDEDNQELVPAGTNYELCLRD